MPGGFESACMLSLRRLPQVLARPVFYVRSTPARPIS